MIAFCIVVAFPILNPPQTERDDGLLQQVWW
jgi:hypothetical protein